LKQLNNILIQVHCVAHRLNLAASQASKDTNYLERYQGQINRVYKFYSNSSVRYDKLEETQQLMHGKVKQVVEPSSVRWLLEFKTILTVGPQRFSCGPSTLN